MLMLYKLIKKNKTLYPLAVKIEGIYRRTLGRSRVFFWVKERIFVYPRRRLGYFMRGIDIIESRKYRRLKRFKDIHKGERCFIVCTGPSLRLDDLEKIKDEICFYMNSMIMLFDKIPWRPDYYFLNNNEDIRGLINEAVQQGGLKTIFISSSDRKKYDLDEPAFYSYPIINSKMSFDKKIIKNPSVTSISDRIYKFSDNIYRGVSGGATTTNAGLQIAVYMGFSEIYLIGCDCDLLGPEVHHPDVEYTKPWYEDRTMPELVTARMIVGYEKARQYADSHGIKIYNATRGGKLEVFERVDFDEIVARR